MKTLDVPKVSKSLSQKIHSKKGNQELDIKLMNNLPSNTKCNNIAVILIIKTSDVIFSTITN